MIANIFAALFFAIGVYAFASASLNVRSMFFIKHKRDQIKVELWDKVWMHGLTFVISMAATVSMLVFA